MPNESGRRLTASDTLAKFPTDSSINAMSDLEAKKKDATADRRKQILRAAIEVFAEDLWLVPFWEHCL